MLPDGSVWNGLSRLRKDNTGYDLRNLLIGSEGTLGIITAATLKMSPRPVAEGTAFLVVPSPQAAVDLLSLTRNEIGDQTTAFEIMHRQGLEFLEETLPDVRQPFDAKPEWCVLIEVGLSSRLDPVEVLERLFESATGAGLVLDGLVAQSQRQSNEFWAVREHLPEANRRIGAIAIHDISIPISLIPDFIKQSDQRIAEIGDFRINCFGHLGDGNLHYNVYPVSGRSRADHQDHRDLIKRAIYDLVQEMHGSISAEHGIGRLKVDELEHYGDWVKLGAMRSIKAALDPLGILNPGAVLRN
ncbi:MAG: FAD-binding oxidoreductase [Hyphomicrobiales bacterium]|nr:FAD-binding oxidoreductase [Hyphomicrobiales bacterium]